MRTSLRLFYMETRHNVGLWVAPVILAAAWLLASNDLDMGVLLWTRSSVLVRDTVFLGSPLIAGAAAWMAGRDRRRGVEELLVTVPAAPAPRRLATWAGTTLWAIAAYVLFGLYVVIVTAREATWGGPTLWPMVVGLLALPACAAVGFAAATYVPSRFTAPLVAIGVLLFQLFLGEIAIGFEGYRWFVFLSPIVRLQTGVWNGVEPDVGLPQALFLLGVAGIALGSVAIRKRESAWPWVVPLAAAVLALAGVLMLVDVERRLIKKSFSSYIESAPYEPVCRGQHLPVCLHPAYSAFLDDLAGAVEEMAAPLAGLPGVPTRVIQREGSVSGLEPDEQPIAIHLNTYTWAGYNATYEIADHLVSDAGYLSSPAQYALKAWLLRQTDREVHCDADGHRGRSIFSTAECAAAGRFQALSPVEQRQWLEANYEALRAGQLQLEDLP